MECMRNQLREGVLLHGRYETIAPLNHGSFGMVFQAKDRLTGDVVAIKCLTKPAAAALGLSPFAVDDKSEELAIHLRIGSHPNIVNLLHSFDTQHHVYLVLEYCANGDLYEAIRVAKGPLETQHVRDCMLQLVDAIEHLHAHGIYHRDIKPENLFLTHSGALKVGDFGLATSQPWSVEPAVGSDRYMAPEQYDPPAAGYSPAQADIWAVGICLLNVLFSRNPFALPSAADPLYADFALDRQTLFDVFPTMSQDTFAVLVHCLAVDPAKRTLSRVRDALMRVVRFTTDDETLDDFCTEDREPVVATAFREPLRTPSLSTPQLEQGGSFPWAKALAMTSPPVPIRQLSAIPDTEVYADDDDDDDVVLQDRDASTRRRWYDAPKPDTASTASFADSGLGLSFSSTKPIHIHQHHRGSKALALAGSLPADVGGSGWAALVSARHNAKRNDCSKSWSELYDEDEEELLGLSEAENDYLPPSSVHHDKPWAGSRHTSGVSTPRGGLAELTNPAATNNRSRSPKHARDGSAAHAHISEQTGFVFEPHTHTHPHPHPHVARYSPPAKRSAVDKWAALGDRRRGQPMTPLKALRASQPASPATGSAKKRARVHSHGRAFAWSPGAAEHDLSLLDRKAAAWSASKDWRQPGGPVHARDDDDDDMGDLEWVGGWHDLHL